MNAPGALTEVGDSGTFSSSRGPGDDAKHYQVRAVRRAVEEAQS